MDFNVDEWCAEFLRKLEDAFGGGLVFVGLQGSRGRGEASEESDVDLVVVLKELAPALERHPLIASLVVTSDTLPVDRIKVKTAGNLLNVNYKKLASGRK